jgi:membrane protease YdiL (CAAX protease family)
MLSEKPWRAEAVMLFCGAQFVCLAAGLTLIGLLQRAGLAAFKSPESFGAVLLLTLCFQGATWLLIPFLLRWNEINWRNFFGLQKKNLLRRLGWMSVVLTVALVFECAYEITLQKIGWESQPEAAVKLLLDAPVWPTGIYLGVFAVVLAPVAEEFIFRGVLFRFFKRFPWPALVRLFRAVNMPTFARLTPGRRFWRIFAWLGVSSLFALIHGDIAIFIPLFVLALALTWLYEKTGNLLAPIAAHSLFNMANLVILLLQK